MSLTKNTSDHHEQLRLKILQQRSFLLKTESFDLFPKEGICSANGRVYERVLGFL